jgi:succinate dehydrogenase hydrophobic anchor subunit
VSLNSRQQGSTKLEMVWLSPIKATTHRNVWDVIVLLLLLKIVLHACIVMRTIVLHVLVIPNSLICKSWIVWSVNSWDE